MIKELPPFRRQLPDQDLKVSSLSKWISESVVGVTLKYGPRSRFLINTHKVNAVVYHQDIIDKNELLNDWVAGLMQNLAQFHAQYNQIAKDQISKTLVLFASEKDHVFSDEAYEHYTAGLWLMHGLTGKAVKLTLNYEKDDITTEMLMVLIRRAII